MVIREAYIKGGARRQALAEQSAESFAARRFPPFPVDNAPCCAILCSKEIEVDLKS